jgi:hypothetical protein
MVPTAQLRVFAPLEWFPPRERERWAAYVDAGQGLTKSQMVAAEHAAAARLLVGHAVLGPDAALVRRSGDRFLICPLQLDLRAAHALTVFRRRVPEVIADLFLPHRSSREQLTARAASGRIPHILDEPWAVPLHWFVAFAADERHVTDPLEGSGPRVRFLTTVGQAVLRVERAIDVVEATIEDGDEVLLTLADLAGWLDLFPTDAVLELDYASVAATLTADELRTDRTCEDLTEALDALAEGDMLAAAAAYGSARARWMHRRAREHAS